MIRKVKFNNFYSFKKEQEINFLANKKESYDYLKSETGDQITKIAGFIGGNASGKTNIMRLFSFIRYFICETSKEDSEAQSYIAIKTFFNNPRKSNFCIEFETDNKIFEYEFTVQNNAILRESLLMKKIQSGARKSTVYVREDNNIKKLNSHFFQELPKNFIKNIRSDISLIAFLKSGYNIDIINIVFDYFAKMQTNINERGDINTESRKARTLRLYFQDNKLKQEMENFVFNFDIGLKSFEIKRIEENNKAFISIKGVHNTNEDSKTLDFAYESRGTRSLVFTIANVLSALRNNSVAIIDEIELGLHPEALNKLIRFFIDQNSNGTAQLLFSSHSLGFLSILDMHQIYLVEKDNNGESFSYRLNQVEAVRSDENFLAKYMTGSYGAFPKIKI